MSCSECLHYEVCDALEANGISKIHPKMCGCYKNNADFENKIKADIVRKMQDRLGKHFCHDPAFLGVEQRLIMDIIDQIAKKMLEGEK